MAITKILNINCSTEGNPATHLKNALEYIQNPDKTEKCHLVGSVNCLPDSAYEQMLGTKRVYGKSGKRQGYHVIISFPPDEAVTPEQARFVAEGFIGDILKGEYEAVYGIHTDKEHIHIHIIWNSVNLVTGEKYNSPKGNWKNHLQPVTNKYCEMLGLDIMPAEYAKNPVNMSKEKWEYEQSFKDYILNDAKLCLSYAGSLEHFIFLMKRMGYEFKGKDYLSVKIPGMKLYHQLDKMDDIFSKEEMENKARLFDFRIDENSYNLKLHAEVLKKLGIHMYGSEDFEDYQGIYEETMKKAEKQGSDYECGYYDKKWERSRGR